mmetsp:Transcript_15162/g.32498  ORF Transcript_15162/g.32498 Transcript_15162/m.32498 type:complete len:319 (+) Transcript_15162:60-1016(+)
MRDGMDTRMIALHGLAACGVVLLLVIVARVVGFVWRYALRPKASFAKYKGEWAVITGASAGLGAAFAKQLAKRGLNVVLLARSEDKMQAIASEIESKYGVQTKLMKFDFGSATEVEFNHLKSEVLEGLVVSVLVNNVSVNVPFPVDFLETDPAIIEQMLRINVGTTTKMTRMLLPAMVERKRGIVYMMSSAGGTLSPAPMLSVYGATKAYMDSFAVSISGEVAASGVTVHSCVPFFVKTEMSKIRKTSITVPDPDAFVGNTLNSCGYEPRLCPHWAHMLMANALRLLPLRRQVAYVHATHKDLHRRALRKLERESKKN